MVEALLDDTIAALATTPGRSALALIRVSGPGSVGILSSVCPELRGTLPAERVATLLRLVEPRSGELIDRCLVTWFAGPRSFTGEDGFEVSSHGGALTPQLVLAALVAAGARPALPGEFSRRSVLNGKLDLLQAEAVADLIDSRSPALHRASLHQVEGGLSRRIGELRASLLRLEALLGYGIDFPDEDEPPVPDEAIAIATRETLAAIDAMLATAPQAELLRAGALVVLAGVPNAGKSSLFNALLGVERAIVTELPGTTRDAVEAEATLGGFPFRLVDTAGLRSTSDRVEALGIEVARRYLGSADVIVFCCEAGRPLLREERRFLDDLGQRPDRVVLVVRTKIDGHPDAASPDEGSIPVSVVTGAGLPELAARLTAAAFSGISAPTDEVPLVTRERHVLGLREARGELSVFLEALRVGVPPELSATHLRAATGALESLIGTVAADDVLGQIFSSFCVGK